MSKALLTITHDHPLLAFAGDNRNAASRIGLFAAWQQATGGRWFNPDLAAYRDHLLAAGRMPSSVAAHLSSIRSAYAALARSNEIRDALYSVTGKGSKADKLAEVSELLIRIQNATDPRTAPVRVVKKQDVFESEHLRLTISQARALLSKPDPATIKGLRDRAIIALMLSTGLREAEIADLDVADLRQEYGGELALRVRQGKGKKQRAVVYGTNAGCLDYVDDYLAAAGVADGPVFRPLKPGRGITRGRMSVRMLQYVLADYPLTIRGALRSVRPHDCRRTYARLEYEAGTPVEAIQQNLGHTNIKTTLSYIGALGADKRRGRGALFQDMPQEPTPEQLSFA